MWELRLPGGGKIGLYPPKHLTVIDLDLIRSFQATSQCRRLFHRFWSWLPAKPICCPRGFAGVPTLCWSFFLPILWPPRSGSPLLLTNTCYSIALLSPLGGLLKNITRIIRNLFCDMCASR
jgi:hypothetical protein